MGEDTPYKLQYPTLLFDPQHTFSLIHNTHESSLDLHTLPRYAHTRSHLQLKGSTIAQYSRPMATPAILASRVYSGCSLRTFPTGLGKNDPYTLEKEDCRRKMEIYIINQTLNTCIYSCNSTTVYNRNLVINSID